MAAHSYVQLRAALDGSFEYEIARARGHVTAALGLSMEELADELVDKLKYDFTSSGLRNAERMKGAAWRAEYYGTGRSLNPAAWIYSKIPLIIQAFENGQTIRARGSKGLLIPNPDVWPGGRMRGRRGQKLGDLWALATARFGPLQVIKRPGHSTIVIALVRESATKAGSFRKASVTAQAKAAKGNFNGLTTVVVFVMAKEAKQERLLRGNVIRARALRDAPRRLDSLFLKYFADIDQSGPRRLSDQAVRRPSAVSGFNIPGRGS